ncbi:DUF302 domain-containing protein [Arthrobacter sp. Edens01]|uniref:DUF302 domain-containing protein n=1 Tax=Arthrobacter sp. Edens01 TaxID=1732020 RepID=UPI0006DB9A7B|nr:DUF302 domain-containing protein [Arthrobacter sp. Edens01]KPN18725.1 hypothetical protein AO716_13190 [Arthrobacter sp. Edens01]
MENTFTVAVRAPFKEAVRLTKESLAAHGFDIMSDSDFAAQLGASAPDWMLGYRILGTCNTALAGEAMELDRAIGVAVPCNVVVREDPGGAVSVIEALNPESLVDLAGQEQLAQVVSRTSDGLQAAMHTLSESAGPV